MKIKELYMTEEKLKKVIEDWNNLFWDNIGKEIDKEKFKENITIWYKDCFKKPQPEIIYCDSFKELLKLETNGKKYPKVNNVFDELRNRLPDLGNSGLLYKVWKALSYLDGIYLSNFSRKYIGAYFDYFGRLGINDPLVKLYIELAKTPSPLIRLYKDCVFVVQQPIEIQFLGNFLHSTKGPAIKFRDGAEDYYIRSVQIDKEIFERVQDRSITLEEVLMIPNEEEKSAVLLMYQELYGEEGIYQFISKCLRQVNSYTHKTGDKTLCYTLFKGELGINEIAYVRCYCPSTDRMFFLGTFPWVKNAKDAVSNLYRIPRKLMPYIKYINRQGERFTTVLTDEGNEIRKNMTKEQFEDLISISGNLYFFFMRYEY